MDESLGQLAGLGTAACWAMTSLFFADASTRVGSLVVNFVRLVLALAMLSLVTSITRGMPWPTDATGHAWLWLSVSGLFGFTLGDLCLLRALVVIGPRLGSLLMSFAPPFTALIGWAILGETLRLDQLLGMTLTVGGVGWALADRRRDDDGDGEKKDESAQAPLDRGAMVRGVLLGIGAGLGQAAGLVLSKYGMGDYDAMAATQIRVVAGGLGFAAIFTATRWWPRVRSALSNRRAMRSTTIGAVFGPFLGVWLSLFAVQHTNAGVAASLMATSPIIIIPMVVLVRREKVGWGGILGTVLAVAGVVLLVR
ncbi:MAG: DMT family transporter [Myxococcota bacterium]